MARKPDFNADDFEALVAKADDFFFDLQAMADLIRAHAASVELPKPIEAARKFSHLAQVAAECSVVVLAAHGMHTDRTELRSRLAAETRDN